MMKACSCASGGVIFVPDEVERQTNSEGAVSSVSYSDLVKEDSFESAIQSGSNIFGQKKMTKITDEDIKAA